MASLNIYLTLTTVVVKYVKSERKNVHILKSWFFGEGSCILSFLTHNTNILTSDFVMFMRDYIVSSCCSELAGLSDSIWSRTDVCTSSSEVPHEYNVPFPQWPGGGQIIPHWLERWVTGLIRWGRGWELVLILLSRDLASHQHANWDWNYMETNKMRKVKW